METSVKSGKPYCFVITSYGLRPDNKESEVMIDFNEIYKTLLEPAIRKAGLEPLLEKDERSGGSIHKTMYEKIILSEFCVADLTNQNPNVYYELGMRYATKPYTTIPIIASRHFPLPFDVGPNRTFAYQVSEKFELINIQADIDALALRLEISKKYRDTDSPLYDLVNGISFHNSVAHEKTDIFREKVRYNNAIKGELAYARSVGGEQDASKQLTRTKAIQDVIEKYKPFEDLETGVLIDMMISFRNIEAFIEMQAFIESMPRYVFETTMVQEQYAFVLNRNGGKKNPVDNVMLDEAELILSQLEQNGKASSETYGIWGRIHKDRFERTYKAGYKREALTHADMAKQFYQKGFEFDIRDAYPGVNYVTCLELLGERDQALRLIPAVEYAVLTKMKRKNPDYWDHATLLELAVIDGNFEEAEKQYYLAKPKITEVWMPGTTLKNLEFIFNYRTERGEETKSIGKIMALFRENKK